MDFMLLYSPIGYFASMTVLLGFVYLITSFFLSKPILHNNNGVNSSRTETIDGLRGFLATAVFFHHALIYHLYLLSGIWQLPSSDFFIQLGQTGVSLFFMITGFLFFQKAIQSGGFIKWPSYIVSRIFRIGPIYFLAIGLMLLVIFVRSHWHLYVSGVTLLKQLSSFLFMGLVNVTAVNGDKNPLQILAGVTWTLHYEWIFYLVVFPLTCLFIQKIKQYFSLAFIGYAFLIGAVHFKQHSSLSINAMTLFFGGMLAASIKEKFSIVQQKIAHYDFFASVIVTILLLIIFFHCNTAFDALPIAINTLVFILVALGCSVFGLLKMGISKQLGEISYGVYLLQGLFFTAMFSMLGVRDFALHSILQYWLVITVTGAFLIAGAFLAHFLIEKPGMKLGRLIIKKG